jgi:hypothetical protein
VQEVQRDDGEGVGLLAEGDGGMEGTVVEKATDLVTRLIPLLNLEVRVVVGNLAAWRVKRRAASSMEAKCWPRVMGSIASRRSVSVGTVEI